MDCVPMRMPLGNLQEAKEEVELITAPDMTVPDYYLTILQETGYEFSLEKWVLTGLQGGYATLPSQPKPPVLRSSSSSEVQPSCPPYWMMFSSPQQSRLASRHHSDFWEPNPRQRSHSLDPKDPRTAVNFARSDSSGDEGEKKTKTFLLPAKEASLPYSLGGGGGAGGGAEGGPTVPASCQLPGQRRVQRAFTPDLLNPPTCLSSLPHQRRKNLRQCSLSGSLDASSGGGQKKTNHGAEPTQAPTAQKKATQAPTAQKHRPPTTRANTVGGIADIKHSNKLQESLSPYYYSCSATPPRPLGSHAAAPLQPDWSVELLSALSPEERALLRAVTDRGYPLREAIVALQRTGQQSPEQILSYMLACERLCELGYDEAQVEEALEMFQNCETKAKEFLHLLRQFNEMGFQQNAIKEVLLVHDNHWERALEELMMHA